MHPETLRLTLELVQLLSLPAYSECDCSLHCVLGSVVYSAFCNLNRGPSELHRLREMGHVVIIVFEPGAGTFKRGG